MIISSIPTAESGFEITGLFNLRVAGVLGASADGASAAALCRADAPHDLTPAGAAVLSELGVTSMIDLRAPYEVARHPYSFEGIVGLSHPFELVRPGDNPEQLNLAELYQRLLAECGPNLVEVVREVLAAPGGVLLHCTAGKDRTGIIVALLLLATGSSADHVVSDYSQTEANLAGEWTERYLQQAPDELRGLVNARVLSVLNASPSAVMRDTIEWLQQHTGDAANYLIGHGLTESELAQLRSRLSAAPSDSKLI